MGKLVNGLSLQALLVVIINSGLKPTQAHDNERREIPPPLERTRFSD